MVGFVNMAAHSSFIVILFTVLGVTIEAWQNKSVKRVVGSGEDISETPHLSILSKTENLTIMLTSSMVFNTGLLLQSHFMCTTEWNTMNTLVERLSVTVCHYSCMIHHVSPLCVTVGSSPRLWVWQFGTGLAFRHVLTSSFEAYWTFTVVFINISRGCARIIWSSADLEAILANNIYWVKLTHLGPKIN